MSSSLFRLGINLTTIHTCAPLLEPKDERDKIINSCGTGILGGVLASTVTYPQLLYPRIVVTQMKNESLWSAFIRLAQAEGPWIRSHLGHIQGIGGIRGGILGLVYYGLYYRSHK